MKLTAHGIRATLPQGWEGAIVRQAPLDVAATRHHSLRDGGTAGSVGGTGADSAGDPTPGDPTLGDPTPGSPTTGDLRSVDVVASLPVVHLANFALPADRGDFGSGAVERMGEADVFLALVEYGPENLGTALFSDAGPPRRLQVGAFHPFALQRTLPGQAGHQAFFTAAGRPFCLYVVLGGRRDPGALVAAANTALAGLEIGPP